MYNVLIDTKHKMNKTGIYQVFLDDYHLKIDNYNSNKKYKWYMNINSFSILNSFNNISNNINDTIEIYIENGTSFAINYNKNLDTFIDLNDEARGKYSQYFNKFIFKFKEGNPSFKDIVKQFNDFFKTYNIKIEFEEYSCKFIIISKYNSTHKMFINFKNVDNLIGFDNDVFYYMNENESTPGVFEYRTIIANNPCNLNGDYVINLSICQGSDFQTKKIYSNYDNGNQFLLSDIAKTFIINVPLYNIFQFERIINEPVEIELTKNYIQKFDICLKNQDGEIIEGLNFYTLRLSFYYEEIEKLNYNMLIYEKLNLIYLWIANFLSKY